MARTDSACLAIRELALSGPVEALGQLGGYVDEGMTMEGLIDLLRTKTSQGSGGSGLRAAFRHFDKDKSGRVDVPEMQVCVPDLCNSWRFSLRGRRV